MTSRRIGGLDVPPALAGLLDDILERSTFGPSTSTIDVACSGGPDSTALAVIAAGTGRPVVLHHVDHGLRPGGAAEAALVRQLAALLGAGFVGHVVEVSGGGGPEEAARVARQSVLPLGAATGHTMDDQAETVLLNLLRGAGARGLAAMEPGPSHPLLGLRRSELWALVDGLGLEVVRDPSNADLSLRRNAVRHQLLPLADEVAQRDVVPLLARSADLARADELLLEELSKREVPDPTDVAVLRSVAWPLAARAIRRWLKRERGGHQPTAAEVERVFEVVSLARRSTELAGGGRVLRTSGRLRYQQL